MNADPTKRLPADPHPAAGIIGTLVAERYRIDRELGRGGFAVTYRARDIHLSSRSVVIKLLLDHQARNAWVLDKFHQEMQALARIDDPGVVGALDSGNLPDGRPFLVIQFVNGASLRELIASTELPLGRVADIIRQIGKALSAAHDVGVCHRDLKPENIMIQRRRGEDLVRLIDFGIASIRDSQADRTQTSTIVAGTWPYMAPEQFEGKSSPATDIYALAIIAYEMVTGKRPFDAKNPAAAFAQRRKLANIKPRQLRPELPVEAERILLQALSVDPAHRSSNAADFGNGFGRAVLGDGPGDTFWPPAGMATETMIVASNPISDHGDDSESEDTPNSLMNRAADFCATHNFDQARLTYSECIRLYPDCAEAYAGRARAYAELGEHEQALEDYDEALCLIPHSEELLLGRARSHAALGRHDEALEDLSECIRIRPDLPEAYCARATASMKKGMVRSALEDCIDAIRLKPDYGEAYYQRYLAEQALGDFDSANDDRKEALRLGYAVHSTSA